MGSAYNSDTENEPKAQNIPLYNTHSPILRHRMAHKIQHKFVLNFILWCACTLAYAYFALIYTSTHICIFSHVKSLSFDSML